MKAYNLYYDFGTGIEGPTLIEATTPKAAVQILSKRSGYQMSDYVVKIVELVEDLA